MVLGSLMIFVFIASTVFAQDAEDFQVQPDKIVLNSIKGTADTIKVSFPFHASTVEGVYVDSISFDYAEVEDPAYLFIGFKYCLIDDILHIYFDKDKVIDFLNINVTDRGVVDVDLVVYIDYYDNDVLDTLEFVGDGTVEVVDPSKKESK